MLELEIVKGLSPDNPSERSKTFTDKGGVIGRDVAADWVFHDPSRSVSGQHAKVIFSNGNYFLSDLSTNGTFTETGEALRKGEYRLLKAGEVYVIGPYHFEVVRIAHRDSIDPLKEAGLEHLLWEPGEEKKALDPFPSLDLPIQSKKKTEGANTLKAFDFIPEPFDFRGTAPKATPQDFVQGFCEQFAKALWDEYERRFTTEGERK